VKSRTIPEFRAAIAVQNSTVRFLDGPALQRAIARDRAAMAEFGARSTPHRRPTKLGACIKENPDAIARLAPYKPTHRFVKCVHA
jgi:hypothetical protein